MIGKVASGARLWLASLILAAALAAGNAAAVRDAPELAAGTVLDAVKQLKPGEYLWAPQVAPAGPILFVINITTQRGILYRNGLPIAITTVSTGRPGHRTPTGVFTVLQKQVEHYSSLYDDAPMPYMQRLTWGGVALHGGALPGYPASHGCIRLPREFARLLYGETHLGMTVMIVKRDTLPALAPTSDPLPVGQPDAGSATPFQWTPERAPTGPVSIIVSVADRMLVVLRNGRQIGSAPVTLAAPITHPWLFVLRSIDASGRHWLTLPLFGAATPDAAPLRNGDIGTSEEFRQLVLGILEPGATVVVTSDTLQDRSNADVGALLESK